MLENSGIQQDSVCNRRKPDARARIISAIQLIEEYCETKQASFDMPPKGKFSLNWFTRLATVHKSNKLIATTDGELRPRLDQALSDGKQVYEAIERLDPAKETEVEELKRKNSELEVKLSRLATDVWDLMEENDSLRARLSLKQAQHKDRAKVAMLKDGGDSCDG